MNPRADDDGLLPRPATSGYGELSSKPHERQCAPRARTSAPSTVRSQNEEAPNKAAVAVAHSLIELVWHLLSTGEVFEDLGDDYFHRRQDPERQARRLVTQLEGLGFTVSITAEAAA